MPTLIALLTGLILGYTQAPTQSPVYEIDQYEFCMLNHHQSVNDSGDCLKYLWSEHRQDESEMICQHAEAMWKLNPEALKALEKSSDMDLDYCF